MQLIFIKTYKINSQMENLLEQLQDSNSGITVRTVKNFISKIPSVFTGQLYFLLFLNGIL